MPSSHDDTEHILSESEQLKFDGKFEEAIALLESLVIRDPRNVTALEEIADNELSLGHYDRAARAANQALEIDARSITAHYILGFIASHEQRWPASVELLKAANGLDQNNPEILRCLGWALFNAGKTTEGIVTMERALNLEEDNPLTLCDLGVARLKNGDSEKAQALLRRALDIDPDNARVKECLEMVERIAEHL
jgi:tetratricopeptide (TPR) repeat protein